MENSKSQHILCTNNDILLEVMSKLDAEDQLTLSQVHGNIANVFLKYIWKQKFNLDTNIIEFDENLKAFIDKNYAEIKTLTVKHGQVDFSSDRFAVLVNLTKISLFDVRLSIDDIYEMARISKNLKILELENTKYTSLYMKKVERFTVESLKKLQLSWHSQLQQFIENCPNLEELIVTKIDEYEIKHLNHSLITIDTIASTLDDIYRDYAKVPVNIKTICMNFEILAKKHNATIFNIHHIYMKIDRNYEKFIEHFNLLHLEHVKQLHLSSLESQHDITEFLKLISGNCTELKTLEFSESIVLVKGLSINTPLSLRKIIINVPMPADILFHILKYSALDSCVLSSNLSFCSSLKSPQNYSYGNSIRVLKCNGNCLPEKDMEMFLQLYSNGFQILQGLCLYGFESIERMLQLALKYFSNIKYLNILYCCELNEKILATLIQFPLLKYLKIHPCWMLDKDQLQYLSKHIQRVILVNEFGRRLR